ncbi:MAG TPA: DUF1937 family protein [Steroidobacteraceae bacterium]|jgi:hypothetical protein|nr:DUF1937 family protein [Steroidobacteraceae bacterium]
MILASTLVYIAGPFSGADRGAVEANIHRAALRGVEVAKLGACPIVPHSNTSLPEYEHVQPYKFWIAATLEMMRRCDALLTVDGWELSSGARGEVNAMQKMGKPVFHDLDHLRMWLNGRRLEILES